MMIMIIMILIMIGAGQLLFLFINNEDEAEIAKETYKFNIAKMNAEKIDVFNLGDRFPSKSVYRVDFRKGVII